jgi:hypothetical protein
VSWPIVHAGATVTCTHFGQATPMSPFPRVTVSSQPVITMASPYTIAGCELSSTSTPPCLVGSVSAAAARVMAGGSPVVTLGSESVCVPTGDPLRFVSAQGRVLAT